MGSNIGSVSSLSTWKRWSCGGLLASSNLRAAWTAHTWILAVHRSSSTSPARSRFSRPLTSSYSYRLLVRSGGLTVRSPSICCGWSSSLALRSSSALVGVGRHVPRAHSVPSRPPISSSSSTGWVDPRLDRTEHHVGIAAGRRRWPFVLGALRLVTFDRCRAHPKLNLSLESIK